MANKFHSKEYWEAKLQQWLSSGKSAQAWCRENQVVYTTFLGWRNRLGYSKKANRFFSKKKISSSSFIELKTLSSTCSGICLEYEGIKIHLTEDFNVVLLRKCLNVLRGISC